jgi:hypothetical protein
MATADEDAITGLHDLTYEGGITPTIMIMYRMVTNVPTNTTGRNGPYYKKIT